MLNVESQEGGVISLKRYIEREGILITFNNPYFYKQKRMGEMR